VRLNFEKNEKSFKSYMMVTYMHAELSPLRESSQPPPRRSGRRRRPPGGGGGPPSPAPPSPLLLPHAPLPPPLLPLPRWPRGLQHRLRRAAHGREGGGAEGHGRVRAAVPGGVPSARRASSASTSATRASGAAPGSVASHPSFGERAPPWWWASAAWAGGRPDLGPRPPLFCCYCHPHRSPPSPACPSCPRRRRLV